MFDIKSFYEAKDVADAINALVKNPDAEIISGGTDVLIRVREGKDAGRSVVSIHNIEALKGVRLLDDGDLWIGAGTAFSHITNDALIQKIHTHAWGRRGHGGRSSDTQYRNYRRQYLQWSHLRRLCFHHVDPGGRCAVRGS